jgi:hypothetical protein
VAGWQLLSQEGIDLSLVAGVEGKISLFLSLFSRLQFAPSFCSPRVRVDADPSILISAATAKFGSWTRAHGATAPSVGQRFIRAALTPWQFGIRRLASSSLQEQARQSHSKSQRPSKHKHPSSLIIFILIILYDVLSVIRVVTIVNRVKIFYLGFFS